MRILMLQLKCQLIKAPPAAFNVATITTQGHGLTLTRCIFPFAFALALRGLKKLPLLFFQSRDKSQKFFL